MKDAITRGMLLGSLGVCASLAGRAAVVAQDGAKAPEARPVLVPVEPAAFPDFGADDLDQASLRLALEENRRVLAKRPPRPVSLGGVATSTTALLGTLERFERLLPLPRDAFVAAIASELTVLRSVGSDGRGTVLFTAYHSPCYEGSPTKTERCRFPLRRAPAGHEKGKTIFTRREIEREGKLDGLGLEVAWFARRLDAYLMEVQGSGSVRFPDGTVQRLQCSLTNGHAYTSLGKELVKDGKLTREEASIPALRKYFDAHPDELADYLERNESYVFFEKTSDPPRGCAGTAVTAGRSVATDKRFFPPGALGFVVVEVPVYEGGEVKGWKKRFRFVLDDDTGGAIRGPGRVDLYLGADEAAEACAGVMKREGELFYLLAK